MSTFLENKINKTLLVGITGGIGSGKSTISKIFESLGVPVFNSDEVAKNSINTDKEVIEKAAGVAHKYRYQFIGTEHFLYGICTLKGHKLINKHKQIIEEE